MLWPSSIKKCWLPLTTPPGAVGLNAQPISELKLTSVDQFWVWYMKFQNKIYLGYCSQYFTERSLYSCYILFWPIHITTNVVIMLPVQWCNDRALISILPVIFNHTNCFQKLSRLIQLGYKWSLSTWCQVPLMLLNEQCEPCTTSWHLRD